MEIYVRKYVSHQPNPFHLRVRHPQEETTEQPQIVSSAPPPIAQCGCLGVKTNNSLSNNMENKYKNIEWKFQKWEIVFLGLRTITEC